MKRSLTSTHIQAAIGLTILTGVAALLCVRARLRDAEAKKNVDKVIRKRRGNHDAFLALANPMRGTYDAISFRRIRLLIDSGNVGIGYVVTPETSISWITFSKHRDVLPKDIPFKGATNEHPERRYCTEFRILNGLMLANDITPDMQADVDLYTENAPCDSCAKVIEEFLMHFGKARIRVMYRYLPSASPYCDWPRQINDWDSVLKTRIREKHFPLPKYSGPFLERNWYVFLKEKKEIGRFRYEGLDGSLSKWKNSSDGTTVYDVESSDFDEVHRYVKKAPCVFLPIEPGTLPHWTDYK